MNPVLAATVRAATMADLDAMLEVELQAFADVYGADPAPDLIGSLRTRWAGRLDFLGEWARVLDVPDRGIAGLIMCWPGDPKRYDQMCHHFQRDPDSPLRPFMIEPGTAFITNLAVLPTAVRMAGTLRLSLDLADLARRSGIGRLITTTRMPGFAAWFAERFPGRDPDRLALAERHELARTYAYSPMANDPTRPLDPLLRMNADSGGQMLGVFDNWPADRPSLGCGMLFRWDIVPTPRKEST